MGLGAALRALAGLGGPGGAGGTPWGTGDMIGSTNLPASTLADFWSRVTTRYVNNPLVAFDLMNEPTPNIGAATWLSACNLVTAAIRQVDGARPHVTIQPFLGSSVNNNPAFNEPFMQGIVDTPGVRFWCPSTL